jgi:hypothetical protein
MAKVIVEISGHGPAPQAYKSFDSFPVRIGRGYRNDLILYDRYVCSDHLMIFDGEDGWVLEDVSEHNGVLVKGRQSLMKRISIKSGDEVVIGQTRLRFVSPDHRVLPAFQLTKTDRLIRRPLLAVTLTLAIMGIEIFDQYSKSSETIDFSKYLFRILMLPVMVVFWSSLWTFIGQLLRHKQQFIAQYNVTASVVILSYLSSQLSNYAGYFFGSNLVEQMVGAMLGVIQGVFILFGNLTFATRLSMKKKVISAVVIAVVIQLIYIFSFLTMEDDFHQVGDFCGCLKPPYLNFDYKTSPEQFLKDSEKIFPRLEKQLKKSSKSLLGR